MKREEIDGTRFVVLANGLELDSVLQSLLINVSRQLQELDVFEKNVASMKRRMEL